MDPVHKILQGFLSDYCDYLPPTIPLLYEVPPADEFLSNYVVPSLPFLLRLCGDKQITELDELLDKEIDKKRLFPYAVKKWRYASYVNQYMKMDNVTVAATPDGKADSIVDGKFMVPEERRISFKVFLDYYLHSGAQVLCLQKQNNNLIKEFPQLVKDVSPDVPWATEAFGSPPKAANISMGDKHANISMHNNHYENFYFVITGIRKFRLFPPVAVTWMPYQKCPKFQWHFDRIWKKKDLNEEVDWIAPNIEPATKNKHELYCNTKSYVVDIFPGQVLYIPAMWFHEVEQSNKCIGVNYCYDMKYGMKYPYYSLLDKLAKLPFSRQDASVDIQTELECHLLDELLEKKAPIKGVTKKKYLAEKKF